VAPIFPFGSLVPINPAHPANIALRFSWVANGSIAAYDSVIPGRGTVSGAPTVSLDPKLGACVAFGTSSDYFSFAHRSTVNDKNVTMAVVATLNSGSGSDWVFFTSDSSGSGGWRFRVSSSGTLNIVKNGVAGIDSGISIASSVPYLFIASSNATSGATNFLVKRLDIGSIHTATASDTNSPAAPNGTYALGNNAGGVGANAKLGAYLFSAQFMSMAQLQGWAADPWGPWFNDVAASVFATWVGRVSSGTLVTADAVMRPEFLVGQRADPGAALEWLAAQRGNAYASSEFLASQQRDHGDPVEALSSARADPGMPVEGLAHLTADPGAPFEFRATVRIDHGAVPLEWAGALLVTTDSGVRLEALVALRRDETVPGEILARLRIDTAAPGESLAGARLDFPLPLEWSGRVAADAGGPLEWGAAAVAAALRATLRATATKRFRIAAAQPRRRIATLRPNLTMSQARDLSPPMDAAIEQEIVGFDFGPALAAGVTITGVADLACAVYQGADDSPASRLLGAPQIVASSATGAASAQVNQLFGTMVAGTTYRLQCLVTTSDGQTLSLWTHVASSAPN
jgi:hypothetical protein